MVAKLILIAALFSSVYAIGETVGSEYIEVSPYRPVRDNLYDRGAELYFKSARAAIGKKVGDPVLHEDIYIKRFGFEDSDKKKLDERLADVVDPETWKRINTVFYRDKKNLYCFHSDTGGGYLVYLETISPNNLVFYTEDGKKSIEEIRATRKQASQSSRGCDTKDYFYSTDGANVYYLCSVVDGADPDSFELIKSYAAKDKFSNYFNGVKE
ncbi:DKNYY domain-containing protein [Microbulbifer sp. TYP-18]|uniref:DKNYY domain-containing protein n=1 Tax=Microbulbifer sp. TYP-18 TaxID=3230024 RepID=UPI0034C6C26A